MIEDSQTLRRGFRANQNLIVLHWSFSLSCGLIFLIVCSNAGVGCTFRRCRETAPPARGFSNRSAASLRQSRSLVIKVALREFSHYTYLIASTHEKVCYRQKSMAKKYTPLSAAQDVEAALRLLEGRWKLVILFHLFGGKVLRYSDLERAIPNITQKMLGQQLRQLESDGIVVRKAYPQVPPRVEYSLTAWGQTLCPVLDAILKWADLRH